MTLLALHPVDFGVLLLYFAAMLAIGFYFRREQHTSRDFFLAGRSMSWFPVGISLVATLLSGLNYAGMPGESYWVGLKFLVLPASIWLTAPLLVWCFIPVYHGLELNSVYEYLELRFDSVTRLVSSLVFIVWRLVWLGGVLYVPCKLLTVAANVEIPLWILISSTGLIATIYTFLGGMKTVIWTDVVFALVSLVGVLAIICGAWWGLQGGPSRVWEVATILDRTTLLDPEFSWNSSWTVWGVGPYYFLSMLSFYVANQITAQRYLTARTLGEAQRSFLANCVLVSIMIPCLVYAGLCLLTFYHDHPSALRTKWIVNVAGETRQSMTYADRDRLLGETSSGAGDARPLLEWNNPRDSVTVESIEKLVAERRLLHPNRKTPWENASDLFDAEKPDQLDREKLAMRQPPKPGLKRGEVILNVQAKDELMLWFIATQLPFGVAGLVLAGVFAATMSAMDSGLNAIGTLAVMDLHRRYGWGRKWLARRVNKPENELTEADELRLGRPLTLATGVAATLFSVAIAETGNVFSIMLAVMNTCGASLLGVFLLGIFTRRCTAVGAILALVCGTLFTVWLMVANSYPAFAWLWPFEQKLSSIWPVTFGTLFTFVFGYVTSIFYGEKKNRTQLSGLVLGCGRLGARAVRGESIDTTRQPTA